jgi:excisionase family DNA binding protein
MLTVKQASTRLSVSSSLIYSLCSRGALRHARFGIGARGRGAIRISEEALAEFENRCMVRPSITVVADSVARVPTLKHVKLRQDRPVT